ncbi:MAG: L-fucose/L-arabinose isomerase family protein [Rhizobiaceae bacterium]
MKNKARLTVGVLPLARPTFDVPYAEERAAAMFAALERSGHRLSGSRELLFDAAAAQRALALLVSEKPDRVLILQVTFTDAAMAVEIAGSFASPVAIWAIPEPRLGGRLRLNAFCGLNLAAHALGVTGKAFGYLYAAPEAKDIGKALDELLAGGRDSAPRELRPAIEANIEGAEAVAAMRGARIGRIGERPAGFHTCDYDPGRLSELADVRVERIDLTDFFARAKRVPRTKVAVERAAAAAVAGGLDAVDQAELDRSLRLRAALAGMRDEGRYDAFAIRCWPETFTEYGGAVCGPVSMMGERRIPCACEADVYGALTTLLLQKIADQPAFLADLVDIDIADDTGVVWHCGQAPASMMEPTFKARATIHTNRKMPLLFEFPLKGGRVTFFRVSQARGRVSAVIGGGEMLARPMAFTGTSGVVRFDAGARSVLAAIMDGALEHHLALAYGDHRATLESAAHALGIPVFDL